MNRRKFIRNTAIASMGVGFFVGSNTYAKDKSIPLRFASIGCGGKGYTNMMDFQGLNPWANPPATELPKNLSYQAPIFNALCDVDSSARVTNGLKHAMFGRHLDVYKDYRKMLDKEHKNLDAVVISTPDVSHFAAAMLSLEYGLPIWVEKPLCHDIWQIRTLQAKAREKKVITQMGNQGHSAEGIQYCKEWIAAGLIGKVREIVIWTDRPYRGMQHRSSLKNPSNWGKLATPPATLDWDLWQNVATQEAYRQNIVPTSWRTWWKYGSGALGDMACHMLDIPIYALDLPIPSKVVSRQANGDSIIVPGQDAVDYYFETSNQGVPVKISWHSGVIPSSLQKTKNNYNPQLLPKLPKEFTDSGRGIDSLPENGQFIIGDEGVIFSPTSYLVKKPILLPKEKWDDVKNNLPEHKNKYPNKHWGNFVNSVKGLEKPSSEFEYAGRLSEIVQLGNMSLRTNSEIIWNANEMSCKDNIAANELVKEPMREGWY